MGRHANWERRIFSWDVGAGDIVKLRLEELRPGDVLFASWRSDRPMMFLGSILTHSDPHALWMAYFFLDGSELHLASCSATNTLTYDIIVRA